jgi:DNA-binding response OmpR family regulator
MTGPLIAVVEDEEHIAQGLIFNLEAEGYRVHHESDGQAALAWLRSPDEEPAAVLLDVMLPGLDGFSILRALREAERYTPVLLLTARGRDEDIVEGFTAGADDYLAKPFDLSVLLARLTALLRRMQWQQRSLTAAPAADAPAEAAFVFGDRTVNLETLEVLTPANVIHLTLMEADLLRYLLKRPGVVIPRKELLEKVWKVNENTDTRPIDNFIVRLRRYLEPDPSKPVYLLTVRGVGYRFMPANTGGQP